MDRGGCDLQNQAELAYHKLGSQPIFDQFLKSKGIQEGNLDYSYTAKVWWRRIGRRKIDTEHTKMYIIRNVHRMKEKKNNKKERERNGNSKSKYLGTFIYIFF